MRLQNVITLRLSLLKAAVIALWAFFFYFAIIKEISDKTDDNLTEYAEALITDYLAWQPLYGSHKGSDYQYYIHKVSENYASARSHIRYKDMEVYMEEKNKYEPARTITYIFRTDDGQYRELVVFTPTIDKSNLKQAIFSWLAVLYTGLLGAMVIVNLWTIRHSMKPLEALFRWLDAYKLGQKGRPLANDTNITEFRKLNDTVISSVRRNEEQYEQQNMFIANASHEMQTPLAICQNRLEILLDDENLTESQMADIIKTLRTIKSLASTNRSLLLLCKIDNGQFVNRVPVSFKELTDKILPDLKSVYAYKKITVDGSYTDAPVADMDESLANILLSNLLKNAFTHNVEGGIITITSNGSMFRVANTGCPAALDGHRIFERFYHSAEKKSSTGLGLALVKSICTLYGMTIKYSFGNGLHTFEITDSKK